MSRKLNADFIEFVEKNPKLVTRRESTRYPGLFVLKYSRMVFYDALWNEYLEECRGTVVDAEWNVVVRPFKKIYNRNENGADFPLDEKVTMVRKVNGFMAAATYVEGHGVVVSTTGSLDSEFVDMANYFLAPSIIPYIEKQGQMITWLFEICHPDDPHIIPELPGAYLIGARFVESGGMIDEKNLNSIALEMGVKRPNMLSLSFRTVLELVKKCRHEGFVVHGPNSSLKIKSPFYLLTKFIARAQELKLGAILDGDHDQTIDEEFYPLLAYLREHREHMMGLDEQARLEFIRKYYD